MSLTYIRNSKGPATDPWGMPHVTFKKRRFSMSYFRTLKPVLSKKQEVLGVFLLLHCKTIFQVIYYDQHSQGLCLGLETECKLLI